MSRWLLAAILALGASAMAVAQSIDERAFAAIEDCIERLDPVVDIGFEKIAARCPDLARTLEQTGWAAWLPQGWKDSRNDLSPGSLAELRTLVEAELQNKPTARTPRVQRLNEILADLGPASRERSGLWARFKQWVRNVFEPGANDQDDSWFSRMVGRVGVSQTVVELITYVALGLIVLLAVLIVVNEIRAAGVLRLEKRQREAAAHADIASRAEVSWSDVERAALLDKPRLLLELVAARLVALGQLPPAAALTVRELTRAARLPEESDRARLNELALAAERARYAEGAVTGAGLDAAVERGRELLLRLTPAAPARSRR